MNYNILIRKNPNKEAYYLFAIESDLAIDELQIKFSDTHEWLKANEHRHYGGECYDLVNYLQQTGAIKHYNTLFAIKGLGGGEKILTHNDMLFEI